MGLKDKGFGINTLFTLGCCFLISASFILTGNPFLKTGTAVFFAFLCAASGKKINLLFSVLTLLSAVFLNIIIPSGKVLFYLGFFPLTEISLRQGFLKGVTIIGLFYISRFFIDYRLRLDHFKVAARTLYYFNTLSENRPEFKKNIISSLDSLFLNVFGSPVKRAPPKDENPKTGAAWYVFYSVMVAVFLGLFLLDILHVI